jgi:hypothetical protein
LDIAKSQFQQEQLFPEQTLQQYQSVIRGFPLAPTTYETRQTTTPAPSYLQQAAGLGGLAFTAAGAAGAFKAKGGKVDSKNGLGSIVVKRQAAGRVAGQPIFDSPVTFQKALAAGIPTYPDLDYSEIDKEREAYFSGISGLRKQLAEQTPEEKAYLERLRSKDFAKRREEVEKEREAAKESATRDKYLAGMDFFSNLLAQGGEKSFLQNIGIAAGESNVTKKLMDAAKEEKKEARLARKELLDIDDQELANMAAVSGVTKQQKQAEINAEVGNLEDRIKKADYMQSRKKEIAADEAAKRKESREVAALLTDDKQTQAALEKAIREGGMKSSDFNAIRNAAAESLGATIVTDPNTGKKEIMFNGKPLTTELRNKINTKIRESVNAFIEAGGSSAGYSAVVDLFPKNPPPGFKVIK